MAVRICVSCYLSNLLQVTAEDDEEIEGFDGSIETVFCQQATESPTVELLAREKKLIDVATQTDTEDIAPVAEAFAAAISIADSSSKVIVSEELKSDDQVLFTFLFI